MESIKTKLLRIQFNFFPAFRRTGGRITYIAHDYFEIRIKLPLNWKTRNYVGTIYGGSIYASVDPIYMMMLIKILGSDYIIWDKAATIRFKKPGRSTLYATFRLEQKEIDFIKNELTQKEKIDRVYYIELVDNQGVVHAYVEKVLHIKNKNPLA